MSDKILSHSSEWNFALLEKYEQHIAKSADKYRLDTFPNHIEIISAEQMMDSFSNVGMPIGYNHWSFGKQFVNIEKNYKRGHMGLAYEIVINANPCISYLLEENTMVMQATVIAHASYGHNSFFKNNYLFNTWTNPDAIIDYMVFAKNYIAECEMKYGVDTVEQLLDACHALMSHGVDRYKRPQKLTLQEEKARQREREDYLQSQVNELWRTIPTSAKSHQKLADTHRFPLEPQENLLYFLEKNAPLLEPWQREIIRITRKIAQYYYPQKQTKVMNEGWATFWHYTLINSLYEEKLVNDQFMLEFIQNHTNLIKQYSFAEKYYHGINPYTLGYHMFADIRRICEQPTAEDKQWFPELANSNWLETLDFAMRNFKDESFIAQYLSPKLIRDLKLFSILDDDKNNDLHVTAIHNDQGFEQLRKILSAQYNLGNIEPNIQVYNVNIKGDRAIILQHVQYNRKPLHDDVTEVLKHFHYLWGFDVILESISPEGNVINTYRCPEEKKVMIKSSDIDAENQAKS